jgi:hypothetical protein
MGIFVDQIRGIFIGVIKVTEGRNNEFIDGIKIRAKQRSVIMFGLFVHLAHLNH